MALSHLFPDGGRVLDLSYDLLGHGEGARWAGGERGGRHGDGSGGRLTATIVQNQVIGYCQLIMLLITSKQQDTSS